MEDFYIASLISTVVATTTLLGLMAYVYIKGGR